MIALLAALMAVPAADSNPAGRVLDAPPAIQVSLNNDGSYTPSGLVQVRVQTTDDGYLTVFRVDGDGRIRVIFPLDPDGDAFVRGGKEYELRGRGDEGTFLADDRSGTGMVYAALSHTPYQFAVFAANGHWDYNALRLSDSSSDAETDLTAIVASMTARTRFDYDAIGYRVQNLGTVTTAVSGGGYYPGFYDPSYNPSWRCLGCGWGTGYAGGGLNFGYSPFADPYLYSPWAYNYGGYGYGGGYYGGGYYGGGYNGYFPGTYPIVVSPRPYRARPNPVPRPSSVAPAFRAPGGGSVGTPQYGNRARPRPADFEAPSRAAGQGNTARPTFRQPSPTANNGNPGQPAQVDRTRRPEPQQQQRPAYREPPRVERSAPPPQTHSSPPPASRPAPAARPEPAPRGGGGRH